MVEARELSMSPLLQSSRNLHPLDTARFLGRVLRRVITLPGWIIAFLVLGTIWLVGRALDRLGDAKVQTSELVRRARAWLARLWRRGRARWPRAWRWLTRLLGFLGGIYLAGLPTYYAMFTVGDAGAAADRVKKIAQPLFVAWVVIAAIVGYLTLSSDRELLAILRPARRRLRSNREYDAANNLVALLLGDVRFSLLRAFGPRVFVCDDRKLPTELYPFEVDHPAEWQRFKIGYGAVGAAFELNLDEPLVFRGEDLQKQNESLSPEQVARYGHLLLVAAIVLRDRDGKPVGTLSVSSSSEQGFGPAESIK